MVSFFGLKFGADKRKKRAGAPPQLSPQWNQTEEYIGRRESYFPLHGGGINRPRTSQGTHGPRGLYPGDPLSQQSDADFKGIRAVLLGTTAAVPAGTGPVLSPTLKTFSSDSNLRVSMETRNLSSTSLYTPPKRLGEASNEMGPRPGTAHSMRGFGAQKPSLPLQLPNVSTSAVGAAPKSPLEQSSLPSPGYCGSESSLGTARENGNEKPNLHIDLPNASTTTFGGTPKSPLGQYELPSPLKSPLKSDTESLLGDDPGKIVDEIAARINREEKPPPPLGFEERRRLEAELEEQKKKLEAAKKKLELARLQMAYPSPPASVESERDALAPAPGRKASIGMQATSHQDEHLSSVAADMTLTPSSPASVKSDGVSFTDTKRTSGSLPTIEASLQSPSLPPNTNRSVEESTEQTGANEKQSLDLQMLRPRHSHETSQDTTGTGTSAATRSPLFQQMTPFDIHSDEEYDEEEHMIDYRAANAPYGLPSPPLSHHQRPSKEDNNQGVVEEEEGLPVLRIVQAKRDTTLVGTRGRTSLGLQIEEFEKSLQQAQAMSALENRPEVVIRSRANSNASSTYSDLSDAEESPLVLEPPLISPKPFPLSPRPMGPRTSTPSENTPKGRPLLEVRAESPFGSFFDSFALETAGMEDAPTTPPAARPRPRLGAVNPSRPTLGEYGPVKVNTVAALAGRRVQRPSLDKYDVAPPRSVNNSFDMDSPILKDVRQTRSPGHGGDMTDGLSSTATSCATSPMAGGVGSYSVFSPPPPIKQRPIIQPPRSATTKPEWYGPAPSAPPTSPLPIPDKSGATTPRRIPTTPQPSLTPTTPGLRTSPSIVPDLTNNPNWPLPAPSGFASPPDGGFAARRSLHRDGRAPPPAPINIMATRYAEEVGGEGGPWTPKAATPKVAGGADSVGFEIRSDFSDWKEEPAPYQRNMVADEGNVAGIGLARGLSIKYDKVRERERRVRGHDQKKRMAIVTVDEETVATPGPSSPTTTGESFDRLRRPNHGLKSPMGFADEQGIRFI